MVPKMHYLLIFLNLDREDFWTLAAVIVIFLSLDEVLSAILFSPFFKQRATMPLVVRMRHAASLRCLNPHRYPANGCRIRPRKANSFQEYIIPQCGKCQPAGVGDSKTVPGAVVAIQTFGDFIGFHPHLHILVSDPPEADFHTKWIRSG